MKMLQPCVHRNGYGGAKVAAEKRHPAKRILRAIGPLLFVVAGCLSFASPASAVTACGTNGVLSAVGNVLTCTYTMSGEDTFNAPLFVTTVHVVAVGQTGGIGSADENVQAAGAGGAGARVAADLPVTQSTLFVEIPATFDPVQKGQGCQADNGDTILCDGGGGGSGDALGGGASVVQTCSVSSSCVLTGNPLTDPRLVVAGGGGGGAFNDTNGGNAGTGPNPVCNLGQKGQSGQGAPPPSVMGGGGSGGGCQVPGWGAGGSGGIGPGGFAANGHMGDSGQVGAGGDGGAKAADPQVIPGCVFVWGGAGGGSGFWGGGGGGGAAGCSGGGGGGGSSFAEVHASNVSMTPDPLATPSVSISWVQPVNREYQFLTGRAVGLSFTQSAPNPGSVTDADTGPVQTSMTETVSPPCQTSVNAPVGGTGTTITDIHACAEVVTTGGSQLISKSMAGATIRGLILRIPGLPVVKALTVISASKTTCAGSTGATYIGFLSIGSDVLISHPQLIAPNTHLSVGQISVNLNEQTPFNLPADRGLLVDAITLSIGSPSSVTAHLIVASSESDIGDCPGQVHIN
jgi:hypothetical protein